MRTHSPIRTAADQLIQAAGRDGVTTSVLMQQLQQQGVSSSLPQLNRVLDTLRNRDHRIVRRWEWVMNAAGGYRAYRYWGVNFWLDANTAPTVRDEAGNAVQPLPPGFDKFRPQVES